MKVLLWRPCVTSRASSTLKNGVSIFAEIRNCLHIPNFIGHIHLYSTYRDLKLFIHIKLLISARVAVSGSVFSGFFVCLWLFYNVWFQADCLYVRTKWQQQYGYLAEDGWTTQLTTLYCEVYYDVIERKRMIVKGRLPHEVESSGVEVITIQAKDNKWFLKQKGALRIHSILENRLFLFFPAARLCTIDAGKVTSLVNSRRRQAPASFGSYWIIYEPQIRNPRSEASSDGFPCCIPFCKKPVFLSTEDRHVDDRQGCPVNMASMVCVGNKRFCWIRRLTIHHEYGIWNRRVRLEK